MHAENSVIMRAPLEKTFQVASDLSLWPRILPHYRSITFLERSAERNIVKMAAWRALPLLAGAKIPVRWTSEQEIDHQRKEMRFHHLTAFTKGMRVVWSFTPSKDGVVVKIVHDLNSRIPVLGRLLAEPIIGRFFIHFIAGQTLHHMKNFVEEYHGT